ncbi:3-dehydroquinate synthase [Runella slithyformis]|uniref:3-dehydroquinate synthase n=1 Tax=Runella slithyformis (strain ATCC 29530 / DSM 19594 / LMG 11500 / NCIMB 11436 / LSU 4) TaxID=761193 RepID=A0A7U4E800_RUNSL|nr:3-dehydroquinate synthase [Runella slithyformis]AEI50848.1 3-dehydroquinate synthase [Runella slithyformis DSM 19594]
MSVHIAPIQDGLRAFLASKEYSKYVVIADTNTRKRCYPLLKSYLPKHHLIVVPAGEQHKNLATCEKIWNEMTRLELDRHALVFNLGGGVIGDMGGFCAATYKRGIDFVQVPTTLLSQVDASVGGKLGIDFQGFKNHLGVFTQPKIVLIDASFLQTLSYVELRSGFAEIVKHCLIADSVKWEEIRKKDFEEQNWPDLIAHSVEIKKGVVAEDPTEKGLRKILNFGHTIGHAVETYFLSKPPKERLLHGEAIAAGMIMEAYIAYRKKMINLQTLEQIEEFIFSVYGKVNLQITDVPTLIQLAQQDKKNKGGELRFSLLTGLGSCGFDIKVSPGEIQQAAAYYAG